MNVSESLRKSLEAQVRQHEADIAPAVPYLQGRGISKDAANTYRLGYVGEGEYAGRLAIPYITADGSVVDIRYRALDGQEPKYMSRPGSTARLFSVTSLIGGTDTICVTEGEIDAITLNMCGIPAIGVPGANAWKSHWRLLLSDYTRIIVICDGDQAGRDFGKRFAQEIDEVQIVHLPDGDDINSMFTRDGSDELRRRVGL